jgi:hypothetical protein
VCPFAGSSTASSGRRIDAEPLTGRWAVSVNVGTSLAPATFWFLPELVRCSCGWELTSFAGDCPVSQRSHRKAGRPVLGWADTVAPRLPAVARMPTFNAPICPVWWSSFSGNLSDFNTTSDSYYLLLMWMYILTHLKFRYVRISNK